MPNIFDGRTDSHEVEAATSGGLARIRDHFVLVVVVSVSVVVVVLDIVVVVVHIVVEIAQQEPDTKTKDFEPSRYPAQEIIYTNYLFIVYTFLFRQTKVSKT